MSPIMEALAEDLVPLIAHEALDEFSGRSNKRWALILISAAVGVAVAVFIMRRRRADIDIEPQPDSA